jgi:hypothetical protein
MNVTVRFAVLNEVRIFEPFPIRNGSRNYFVELSGNRVSEVGVQFADAPADSAPTIKPVQKGRVKAEISDGRAGEFILLAERDIRAWQSLLAPIAFVRIDFDSPKIKFERSKDEPERPGELRSFATSMDERAVHGLEDYSMPDAHFAPSTRAFRSLK